MLPRAGAIAILFATIAVVWMLAVGEWGFAPYQIFGVATILLALPLVVAPLDAVAVYFWNRRARRIRTGEPSNDADDFAKALLIVPAAMAAFPLVWCPAAEWLALSPIGNGLIYGLVITLIGVLCCLICVPGFIIGLLLLAVARRRQLAGLVVCGSVGFVAGFIASAFLVDRIRMNAFEALAVRSEPLVNAIKEYDLANESPPPSLEALTPHYLAEVPWTRMGANPSLPSRVFGARERH